MRRAPTLLILFCLAVPSVLSAQARPPLPAGEYGRWESLGPAVLSPDGRWLAHVVNRVDEENELRLRGGARDTVLVVPFGVRPIFTPDSRWVAWAVGASPAEREAAERDRSPSREGAGLADLRTGATLSFEEVQSFRFSGDGRFLLLRGYPAEGRRTAHVVVRDLEAGTSVSFGNVADQAWSDRGALLAMAMETEAGAGNGVQVYDAARGVLRVLDSSSDLYRQLSWRRSGDDLAVLRTRPDPAFRDTAHVALAWRGAGRESPERMELDPGAVPAGMRVAEHRVPEWAKDGSAVYVGLRPREAARPAVTAGTGSAGEDGDGTEVGARDPAAGPPQGPSAGDTERVSDVQVWHSRDVRIIPMQRSQEQQDLRRTLLAAWHLEPGRIVQIGTDLLETARVLEGGRWATETDRKPYSFGAMFGRPASDVWLVDVTTGERRKVLENVSHFQGGSPTGERLLWFEGGHWWAYEVGSGRRTNLSEVAGADFRNELHDYPVDALPPWGAAGWTAGDGALLVHDRYDLWSLAPDGSGGRRLTDGAAEGVVHRYVRAVPDEEGIDPSRPLLVSLFGERTKRSGWARVRPGRAPERLRFEDARLSRLVRADSAETYAFTVERFDVPPDWWVAGAGLASPRRFTETNAFQGEWAWGRSELVDFQSAAGLPLQAALLYPADHDPTRVYPMIVYTYERLSQNLHAYVVPSERSYYNFTAFTQHGYFVLLPDIVYRGRDPGVSALEAVEPAVRAVVERGLVDPGRIGLVGHSWGGYQATYLPTRTDLFAASVAGAPITNFVSFAGAIHWGPGFPEFDHWETGQARMAVAPWEDWDAHVRNSPIHGVHELRTPMLMMFGDEDGTVDWHQGIEFYNFARRAGRDDFVLLVYPGEDHSLRRRENQVDYHRRILEWFGHWLKGEPAPEWITRGVTWLERATLLESRR